MTQICSISVGKVQSLTQPIGDGTPIIYSAIRKLPISTLHNVTEIMIGQLGVAGDEQSNLQVHGGIEKAIYAYAFEHYAFWKDCLVRQNHFDPQHELAHGFFGENLTVSGLLEKDVFIGDNWHVGQTILQVTQFREPCFKLNIKMNFKAAAKTMVQSGFSGWYLRVLKTGTMQAGDAITVEPGSRQISIADQNQTFYRLKGQTDLEF
ncbi:MOSC domain-containing protein [Polynucleobacter sp. SHI8]|uniref:MOSC domain-containing protein n=1 Tax=unclassified Polynucleobacter TaxID=2640945 RepID=UPI00249190B9|nr:MULTISPECIES: MOSC domain-containing protein [unclassified Polynucleobacter]BDW12035.1 MOSC domain-containing protein [Polynucleobacter sp. SHI2]BDW14483.1 MOSC domain-containing protein [Polynucleobacter sp. SHI8]